MGASIGFEAEHGRLPKVPNVETGAALEASVPPIPSLERVGRHDCLASIVPHNEQFSMSQTVGDFLVQRLQQWGVRHVFGYPGDGINGVFGALNRAHDKIRFVQARHEEMAAFMASAYAKFSGRLGVSIATSGPGASHLTTGLTML
jgi:hypothetical protein